MHVWLSMPREYMSLIKNDISALAGRVGGGPFFIFGWEAEGLDPGFLSAGAPTETGYDLLQGASSWLTP